MGILSNTTSIFQFQVNGKLPEKNHEQWIAECVQKQCFRPIDETPDEESIGWTFLEDSRATDFDTDRSFLRDRYVALALRRDQRKVPATLLKNHVKDMEERFMAAHPGMRWVPRDRLKEIREEVHAVLLAKTFPTPTMVDLVWDTQRKLVSITSLSLNTIDLMQSVFKETFSGHSIVPMHPYARAEKLVDSSLRSILQKANGAVEEDVVSHIKGNRWLGRDFMLWLLHNTAKGNLDYPINAPGPRGKDEVFTSYIEDRIVLKKERESGDQKIAITGPPEDFGEARKALQTGKEIEEAAIAFELGEQTWKLTLKGEFFAFASLKCPKVQMETGDAVDEMMERMGYFFERMSLVETGLQLFDSLYKSFLAERLGGAWSKRAAAVKKWAGG
jgi:recombination associated protein RdgC